MEDLPTREAIAPPAPPSSPGIAEIPASSRIRMSLNRSFKLFLLPPFTPLVSPSSSSLLSIISGLLVRVATELAVFLLGETAGGEVAVASLAEFLESQEKGLVSLRGGGRSTGGGCEAGGLGAVRGFF